MSSFKRWLAFLAGVLLAAAGVAGVRGYQYARTGSALCTDCHADSPGLTDKGIKSHTLRDCAVCHPMGVWTAVMLWRQDMSLNGSERRAADVVTPHGTVPAGTCEACHTGAKAPGTPAAGLGKDITTTSGHAAHAKVQPPIPCTECHDRGVHAGRPGDASCKSCHEKVVNTSSAMAQVHCLQCHDYVGQVEQPGRRPGFGRCEKCHAGHDPKAPAIALHAEMPCATCHQPHREPFTVARDCETCHDKMVHGHPRPGERGVPAVAPGKDAGDGSAYCILCHKPHDEWTRATERCPTCHEEQLLAALPHRAPEAMVLADDLLSAIAEQSAHVDCAQCHRPHDKAGSMAARGCLDCHAEVHEPKTHGKVPCTECHSPHTPRPKDCQECHGEARHKHGTETCSSCHKLHTPDFKPPACESCHKTIAPAAGQPAHPKSFCTDCHTPHKPGAKTCGECHGKEVALAAQVHGRPKEHQDCKGCHAPHTWKFAGDGCAECHAKQVEATSHQKGHARCADCHTPHSQAAPVPGRCIDCHKKEATQANPGHRTCPDCHTVHEGGRTEKTCATCHKKQAVPARGLPKHTDCAKCHIAHGLPGAKPPACTECHQAKGKLAPLALHSVPKHQGCADCHKAHGAPDASRTTCIKCHEPKRNHYPQMPFCNGCHVFR